MKAQSSPVRAGQRAASGKLCSVLILTLTLPVAAHQGVPPPSAQQTVNALSMVPELVLPPTDLQSELAADAKDKGGGPQRFAVARPVAVSPATYGAWEPVANGRLWRLRVSSSGATDLNLGFASFWLPKGASLYVVAEKEPYYQGPYTAADNMEAGQLWTPVVPGEAAVIELFVPAEASEEPKLLLTQVNTGYRDVFQQKAGTPSPLAGSCEIDVVCPQAAPWTSEVRSVCRLSVNGVVACTATLIMDAAQDFRPYLLTADICGVTPANAATVVVYWNYQSPTCGQHGPGGSLSQNSSGATFRAAKADVDFCLVELTSTPDPNYNVYYAGWDRSGAAPGGGVGIHHPNGEGKCISFSSNPLTTVNSCNALYGISNHWQVFWSQGTTEPGSAGSGIWDPATHLLVGTLTGGYASCATPTEADCYGKFSVAWDSGSAATNRLRDWLDASNTGAWSVAGSNPPWPSNDGCSGAFPMVPGATYVMNTAQATSTGDSAPSCLPSAGKGVWFAYTPPISGAVTISTCGSDYDTVLAVYSGACGSLTEVACNDDYGPACPSSRQASVVFAGSAGTPYYILVAGYYGASGNLQIRTSLPNDSCATPIPLLPDVPVTEDTTTASSTNDAPTCRSNSGAGVWFSFTPSVNESVLVSTCGSAFDTVLAVYTGACGSLTLLACDDDSGPACAGVQASLTFNAAAGVTYYIQAAGYNTNTGMLQIVAKVANDECAGAMMLTPGALYSQNTTDATSVNDPAPCAYNFGKGVWFTFTPTNSGVVAISTCGSDYDTALQVYTGTCGALNAVPNGCNDDWGWACLAKQSSVSFPASIGKNYYILAGGYNGQYGNLSIVANVVPPRVLTVSSLPHAGVAITTGPLDINGQGNGSSSFTRTYPDSATVYLSAPLSDGFNLFLRWQLDGADYTNGVTAIIPMNAAHTATAIYAPPNDYCSGAIQLTNGVAFVEDTTPATDADDPLVPCGSLHKGVWFKVVPATDELVTVSTCGSPVDTVLQVFTGDCGTLKRIPYGCDDDDGPACISLNASVVFSGHAGVTNYILVGSYNPVGGPMTITATSGLVNPYCEVALPLAYGVPFTMTTVTAGWVTNVPPTCQGNFGNSVWFKFTSPITGPVPISTCGSSFDTALAVYTGPCGALTEVDCANDNGPYCAGYNASLTLNAIANTNYYILVGGRNWTSGSLTIMVGTRPVITAARAGNSVQLGWPIYYWPSYVLERYTNSVGVGSPRVWVDQLPNLYGPSYGTSNPPSFFRLTTP